MRNIASLVLGLIFISETVVLAAEEKPVRSISVSGTAQVRTAPDHIVWAISLGDNDKDLLAAKKKSDEKVKAVIGLQKKLGVDGDDIETGPINVRREDQRDQHGNQGTFKYFVVGRSVTIRQRDLKRFDEFLDSLVSAAEMEVSFGFGSSRIPDIRAETRLKALKIAKDKAADMAAIVGAKLGPVLTINEHLQNEGRQNYASSNSIVIESRVEADVATGTFVPGALTEQVTVYATFALE